MALPIKLQLPSGFLDQGVRCGYEVDSKLKKIWAIELDLLSRLLEVCKKYDINVQVFAGTLLGAIRHKGMIPWDDDVDVAMTRPDFERLCFVASKEFAAPYFFQTACNDQRYFCGYARLRNSETTAVLSGTPDSSYNNGIYIDVHVLDGFTESKIKRGFQRFFLRFLIKCLWMYHEDHPRRLTTGDKIARTFRPLVRLLHYETYVDWYDKAAAMFNKECDFVGLVTHLQFGVKYKIRIDELRDTIEVPFEFVFVPVPRHAADVLTRIYGDFMKFPDPSIRGKWHEGEIHFEPEIPYKEYLTTTIAEGRK